MYRKRPCMYNIVDSDFVECPYCNKKLQLLHWGHLKKLHNKTVNDVHIEFPNIPSMTKKESIRRSEARLKCNQQIEKTCNEKYGGIGYKSNTLCNKSINTTIQKFGSENIMKVDKYVDLFRGPNGIPSKNKCPERAEKISKSLKGRPSPLKGKTYKEIHGEEKTKKLIKDRKISGAIACSKCTNPSVPQVKLYEMVKTIYESAILNHTVEWYCIDIAIIDKKIAIEYDGSYWHQDLRKDLERQNDLEKLGWKFIRYIDQLPSIETLTDDINNIEQKRDGLVPSLF